MKEGKHTQALRAQYPSFRDWVLGNLTLAHLEAIRHAPRDCVSFGGNHPLNDEKLAAGVFRAYRQEAIGWLKNQFESLEHFDEMRGHGSSWEAFHHHALIAAIAFMTEEDLTVLTSAFVPPPYPPTAV